MQDRDIFCLICSQLDTLTLEALSRTRLWYLIRQFANSQHFWRLRVDSLCSRELSVRESACWKNTYFVLETILEKRAIEENTYMFPDRVVRDKTALLALLEMGTIPIYKTLSSVIVLTGDLDRALAILNRLDRHREGDITALSDAVLYNRKEIASHLIHKERVPTTEALAEAVRSRSTDMMKLVLEDDRLDPTQNRSSVIALAAERGQEKMLSVLLSDPRVKKGLFQSDIKFMYKKSTSTMERIILKEVELWCVWET